MSTQARVTDVDALENLRSALIVFQDRAKRSVDEVLEEVRRTKQWLEREHKEKLEGILRTLRRKLEQAEQELFNAKLSEFKDSTAREKMLVMRLRQQVSEVEEKLRGVKQWERNYPSLVEPLTKGLTNLRSFLDDDMVRGIYVVQDSIKALDAYRDVKVQQDAPPTPAAEGGAA